MSRFKLYTEEEEKTFISKGKDKSGREVDIEIHASTPTGAAKVLDENHADYNVDRYTLPEQEESTAA